MRLKRLFRSFVLLSFLFSPFGSHQPVRASTNSPGFQASIQDQPILSMVIQPSGLTIGQSALVTVSLNNVPAEGYTSAELTCSYDPNLVEASNIVIGNLFGLDPVTAINGPHDGLFIVAIAGSDGNKVTSSGTVIAFAVRALQAGQTDLDCSARASKGDGTLTNIVSTGNHVIVLGPTVTPTIKPTDCDKAEFIGDINVPPGTVMAPGAPFTKTWRLKNVGSCVWTPSYRIAFFSGEQMNAPSSLQFPVDVAPGQTVDVSLNLTAPSAAGTYRGYWIFQNATGGLFGIGLLANEPWFVDIVVSNIPVTPGSTFTPSPAPNSPTATITPSPMGMMSQTQTPAESTASQSPTPSITPGGLTATQISGVAYDFVAGMCTAIWFSGAGQLPCPGIDDNPNGFVFKVNNPKLETGAIDNRPSLLTFPQNVQDGYIQGFYPPIHIQNGDRFRTTLACEFGAIDCRVAFRLDYQVGADPIKTFWAFLERYEGQSFAADIDLTPLAGKDVKFILTVLADGPFSGDRALWVGPILYRPNGTATPVVPSATLTPIESSTTTPLPDLGMLTGQVYAGKPVTLSLYRDNAVLVTSATAGTDGTFSFTIPVGTYLVFARADGFLGAEGFVTITAGNTSTMPVISLPAGDIDSNNRIDPFDVLTIGMNYNNALPSVADLNSDGIINVLDLELLAKNYRRAGLVPWNDFE